MLSGTWAQLWCLGLVAPWHVESSVARNQTYWQADSSLLDDQGSPQLNISNVDIMNSQKAKNAFIQLFKLEVKKPQQHLTE